MKVLVVYYTMNGHTHRLAEAVAEGARQVGGAEAVLRRVPETLSPADRKRRGASEEAGGIFAAERAGTDSGKDRSPRACGFRNGPAACAGPAGGAN